MGSHLSCSKTSSWCRLWPPSPPATRGHRLHPRLETQELDTAAWTRTRGMRRMRAALQSTLLFPALSNFCHLAVRDREHLRALNGPAVFVSNHVSALDAVVMAEALPPRYRHRSVVVAAADSIFKRKWEARLAQVTVDAFPIPRGGGARPHLEYLKQLLHDKWSVIIFPEGRLTATGAIGAFRDRAASRSPSAGR